MEKTTADIQQLINNKADAKLKNKVRELHNLLYNGEAYDMLKEIEVNIGTAEAPRNISIAYILSDSGLGQKIIEVNTERYRENETKDFLNKVESLREDVDSLLEVTTRVFHHVYFFNTSQIF